MIKIAMIRHGKTYGNTLGRYIGVTDEPLCEEGKKELEQLKVEGEPVETLCSFCGNKYIFSLEELDEFISLTNR